MSLLHLGEWRFLYWQLLYLSENRVVYVVLEDVRSLNFYPLECLRSQIGQHTITHDVLICCLITLLSMLSGVLVCILHLFVYSIVVKLNELLGSALVGLQSYACTQKTILLHSSLSGDTFNCIPHPWTPMQGIPFVYNHPSQG